MPLDAIKIRNLYFSYPGKTQSFWLEIPEWCIAKGERVFLKGASGSGKSTLLNLLAGILVAKEGAYATLRLRSGEMRKVPAKCRATLGTVSNSEHNLEKIGKAGATRWRGNRPTARGLAMNPVDHPHGGGEGKTSGGRCSVTPWGILTKGYPTVRGKKRKNRLNLKLL